jgi:alpha-ketoglutarate-dependent taurine dioxygenase
VRRGYLSPDAPFPLVFEPGREGVAAAEWAAGHRGLIEEELARHGALLFRGFGLDSVAEFERFAQAVCPDLFGDYGDLPREGEGGKVYRSTPYPADKAILMHNESSHLPRWPMKICFYCVEAAREGGETPLVDCRKLYRLLDPALRERFSREQVMYVRNYIEGIDVSWQSFFRTDDPAEVERFCAEAAMRWQWGEDGRLRTSQVRPAVARHPKTGEMLFFNQLQLHHVSCLDPAVRESLLAMYTPDELPRNAYYGDGSPIEDAVVERIRELSREATVAFPWRKGDVLVVDNMLVAHGRNPYVGPRKIVVAMGEMVSDKVLAAAPEEYEAAPAGD